MHTDNDPGKSLDTGHESEEEGREKGLQWLLDMDMSEPEETLFTVKDDEYHDEGLSAFEAEVAGRPLVRGNTGGDDLANYVDEEIVISSDGGSDIFREGAAADDAESSEAAPEVMAIDYSLGRKEKEEGRSDAVDEGADILGLQQDDDIGETYLTIKRVKGAGSQSQGEEASSAAEVVADDVEPVAEEAISETPDSNDQVVCAAQVEELPDVQLSDAPVPSQIVDPGNELVANDGHAVEPVAEPDQIDFSSDPLGGAQSLAEAAQMLSPDHNEGAELGVDLAELEADEQIELAAIAEQEAPLLADELGLEDGLAGEGSEFSEFDSEMLGEDVEPLDLVEEFEAFGDSEAESIDFPAEFENLEGVNDAEAVAIAAVIPAVIEELGERVAARAADLGLNASAVTIDVRMALEEAAVLDCARDGFEPLATVCSQLQSSLAELSEEQESALHVCLLGDDGQQNWNRFFSDDFDVAQHLVTTSEDEAQPEQVDVSNDAIELVAEQESVSSELEQFATEDDLASDDIFGADFADDLADDFASGFDVQSDDSEDIDALFAELSSEEEEVFEAEESSADANDVEAVAELPMDAAADEIERPVSDSDNEIAAEVEAEAFSEVEQPEENPIEVEAAEAEIVAEDEPDQQQENVEQDSLSEEVASEGLAALIGATDASNPNWFAPESIGFNFTTQSNAEIFADFLDAFIEEGSAEVEKLENLIGEWEKDVSVETYYADVCRTLHTVKGIAKGVGLQRMGTLVHNFETLLERLPRPVADEEPLYLRVVNIWLDAVVRGIEHITGEREDIASEIPQIGGAAVAAQPVEEVPASTEAVEAKGEAASRKKATKKKTTKKKAAGKSSKKEKDVVEPSETAVDPQVSMLAALEKKRDKQLADEGAKVLAAQQSVRMTSEKLDLLLNLASQAQQLGVRASQNTTRSKRSSSELQGRLTSVRTHINKIADRALFNVNARSGGSSAEMDALEMDQYSELQEAASILREGVEDLSDLVDVVSRQNAQVEAMLKQQSSVISSISSSIQGARVVPVSRLMPGLRRIVRTVSTDLGKTVSFNVVNETGALDRDHYARLQTVLEHMVRNALDHGIESADERLAAGKPMGGRITIDVRKSGGDYIIRLSDDGKGIDADAIRQSAYEKGLDVDVDELSDEEAIRLIFHKGFTTANELSEISGRGVGMDIVITELQQIGGDISIQSAVGLGTSFEVRIPSNVSVNGALLVAAADQSYAIPLNGLVAVEQVPVEEFFTAVEQGRSLSLFDTECEPAYLGTLCHSVAIPDRTFWDAFVPVIIAGAGENHMAIAIDNVEEALELVVRSLGSQFSTVPGVAGAATTADGEALVALDLNLLVESIGADGVAAVGKVEQEEGQSLLALVVDDSRTQRMVATSQLETVGVETITAENGLVAIDLLNATHRLPDVVLLDVEMPVKDGIETLREIRKSRRYGHLPVIMVTSRTGAKHRALAKDAGCNAYMGKPFNFPALIEQISELTGHELALS